MTVKDLIKELKKFDPDLLVILQRDPEGNGYSPLAGSDDNCAWNPKDKIVGMRELSDHHVKSGYTEEDLGEGDPCVVLWPKY